MEDPERREELWANKGLIAWGQDHSVAFLVRMYFFAPGTNGADPVACYVRRDVALMMRCPRELVECAGGGYISVLEVI